MNTLTVVGIVLIVLGVAGLIYGGITYTTSNEVVDMGSMHIEIDQRKEIPLSPIFGAVAVAVGVIMILVGRRRQAANTSA